MNPYIHTYYVDIRNGMAIQRERQPLSNGAKNADRFVVYLQDSHTNVTLDAVAVSGMVVRPDAQTVPLSGYVEDGAACVVLDEYCYAVPGEIKLTVRISAGDMIQPVLTVYMDVQTSETSIVVDNGVVGSLSMILAEIENMRAATADAREAADTVEQKLQEVRDTTAEPIVAEVEGDTVELDDAAALPAMSVVSMIKAVQAGSGDPTPANIRPITGWNEVQLWHGETVDTSGDPALTESLPQAVYIGSLDWATGLLTVTHKGVAVDGSESWMKMSTSGNAAYQWLPSDYVANKHDGLCSHYTQGKSYTKLNAIYFGTRITICAEQTTAADFKAYLAAQAAAGTPVTIVYPLKTAETAQLTKHRLEMLKGHNELQSSTGSTAVAYVADTKLYIDAKFNSLYSAILAQGANI